MKTRLTEGKLTEVITSCSQVLSTESRLHAVTLQYSQLPTPPSALLGLRTSVFQHLKGLLATLSTSVPAKGTETSLDASIIHKDRGPSEASLSAWACDSFVEDVACQSFIVQISSSGRLLALRPPPSLVSPLCGEDDAGPAGEMVC